MELEPFDLSLINTVNKLVKFIEESIIQPSGRTSTARISG